MTHLPLGPGGEFDAIRRIAARIGAAAAPLGDDCALLEVGGETLALSTDATIEGVHFRREWLSLAELGWRACARALSDLAAEGADAVGVLAAVAAPAEAGADALAEVMGGVADAATAAAARVLGGDVSASDRWHLVITVLGRAARPVTRAGAVPGDAVWVSGTLGAARAALDAWLAGAQPDPAARRAFARPEPRIALGRALAAAGARAMIDLSDGLGGDAAHLAAASGVRVVIDLEQVPLFRPSSYATGDDYELLAAMPPSFGDAEARAIAEATGVPLTRIGRTEAGAGALLRLGGREVAVPAWDHLAAR